MDTENRKEQRSFIVLLNGGGADKTVAEALRQNPRLRRSFYAAIYKDHYEGVHNQIVDFMHEKNLVSEVSHIGKPNIFSLMKMACTDDFMDKLVKEKGDLIDDFWSPDSMTSSDNDPEVSGQTGRKKDGKRPNI